MEVDLLRQATREADDPAHTHICDRTVETNCMALVDRRPACRRGRFCESPRIATFGHVLWRTV